MTNRNRALVVAKPGPLRDSLRSLLLSMPQLELVEQANDDSSTLRALREHHPALVLLDIDLPDGGGLKVLKTIKAQELGCRCLVMTDTAHRQRDAQAAGADVALPKGFPAAELFSVIEWLLSGQPESFLHPELEKMLVRYSRDV